MIKHRLIPKGEYVHALISTTQQPNVLFPVRAMVYDVKYDEYSPQYQIRIKKFYDDVFFLKKNLFGGRFMRDFEGNETKLNLSRVKYKTAKQLANDVFNGVNWEKYLIVVDSVFCAKTIEEQMVLFNNLQDFIFELRLKELHEIARRSIYQKYDGTFSFPSKEEFKIALQRFLQDRIPKDPEWINKLLNEPHADDMNNVEWL